MLQFLLEDPEPLLYHNEPIWRGDEIVGHITSGMYGHTLGGAVGLGYVHQTPDESAESLVNGPYEIEVAGRRIRARASLQPMYGPRSQRMRI
jgi:4-methylaminobutanoate oxidase (formaldehyde-forming)